MGTSNKFLEICKKCKAKCCKACGPTFDKEGVERILREGYGNYFVEVKKGFYELKTKRGVCPYLKKIILANSKKLSHFHVYVGQFMLDSIKGRKNI